VYGNKIAIINVYDGCIVLTPAPTHFSQFTVNGSTFTSVGALQNALLDVIYTRVGGGNVTGTGTTNYLSKFSSSGTLVDSNIYENAGNVVVRPATNQNFVLGSGGTNDLRLVSINDAIDTTQQLSIQGSPLIFRMAGGVESMRLNSNGNLLVGTTSDNGSRLQVNGAATFSGTVTASGGFFNSDIRLKDLIDYDYNVLDIKPISYLWKDGRDEKKHVGYSAQEVQKVMPDAVNEGTDGMLSVNYVEVLVAKIAELENKIKQLEKLCLGTI
jgi:hypothetical protein